MRLLPYDKFTIETDKSKEMVYHLLCKNSDLKKSFLDMPNAKKSFYGKVWYEEFRFLPINKYRSSFIPIIEGQIREYGENTRIDVTMRMAYFTMIFITVWLGLCALMCIFLLFNGTPFVIVPIIFFCIGYGVMYFGYNHEVNKVKMKFVDIFDYIPVS